MGMGPAVWGPIFWTTMHIVTLGYSHTPTEQEKTAAKNFFESLAHVIPCPICKAHYSEVLAESPPAVNSRNDLVDWLFNLHNKVNVKLGKSEITFETFVAKMRALSHMERFQIPPEPSASSWLVPLLLGAAVGVAGVTLIHKWK